MTSTPALRLAQFVLDRAAVMVFCIDRTGRLLYANDAACRALGYSQAELLAQRVFDIDMDPGLSPESIGARWEALRARARVGETVLRTKSGDHVPVDVTSNLVEFEGAAYVVAVARDITERRLLDEQLRQAQKMDAVSRLAGGIAHDFNNLLTAILGYTDLLLGDLGPDDPRQNEVFEVRKAAERAGALTQQLLAFSRRQAVRPEPIDLNELVTAIEPLLRRLVGERIRLSLAIGNDIGRVMADRGQLEQVLVNVVVNAQDAMPAGGRLDIETSVVTMDDDQSRLTGGLSAGSYVRLQVTDTGCGMTDEVKSHLFEPFFTTKKPGGGAGLGLATAYGVVVQARGRIIADSQPGSGSTISVYLPRMTPGDMGDPAVPEADAAAQPDAKLDELILVVEDEPAVRDLVRDVLLREGYRVLTATVPSEAMSHASAVEGRIDLLLTDMVMPEMNGRQLAVQLTAVRPETRVLFMSGYTDQLLVLDDKDADTAFLQKPFSPHSLVRKVREVLERPRD